MSMYSAVVVKCSRRGEGITQTESEIDNQHRGFLLPIYISWSVGRPREYQHSLLVVPAQRSSTHNNPPLACWPLLGALDHTFLITLRVGRACSPSRSLRLAVRQGPPPCGAARVSLFALTAHATAIGNLQPIAKQLVEHLSAADPIAAANLRLA